MFAEKRYRSAAEFGQMSWVSTGVIGASSLHCSIDTVCAKLLNVHLFGDLLVR